MYCIEVCLVFNLFTFCYKTFYAYVQYHIIVMSIAL